MRQQLWINTREKIMQEKYTLGYLGYNLIILMYFLLFVYVFAVKKTRG